MKTKTMNLLRPFCIAVLMIALLITMNGCAKEKMGTPENLSNHHSLSDATKASDNLKTLYQYPVTDPAGNIITWIIYGCFWPAQNCLPTVVVNATGNKLGGLFLDSFNNGTVNEFFLEENFLEIFPDLKDMPDIVDGLCNSEIILHHEIGRDSLDYFIGLEKGTDFLSNWKGKEKCVFVLDTR